MFLVYLFLFGFSISTESQWLSEFKIYEPFLLYYPTFILISIANWLEWKRMILLFWTVMSYYIIATHITFGVMSFLYYFGMIWINVLVPLIIMVIARIVLGFIELIQKNQELVRTIKHILQVFPEGVIIQSIEESQPEGLVVRFVNDTAKKEILTYENPIDCSIDESKMHYLVKEIQKDADTVDQDAARSSLKITDILNSHLLILKDNNLDATSEIEIK